MPATKKNLETIVNSRSFLRWAGSKRKLVPTLQEYWRQEFSFYIEPFMGSAQLFYAVSGAKGYIISDKNKELVDTYIQIQKQPYAVYRILREFKNSKKEYYKIRNSDVNKLGKNQKAARFIYLNWLCFNGLYRTNNNGYFNVPYSGETRKSIDNWPLLRLASQKLKEAIIIHGDFESVTRKYLKKNDFVYLDPPYALENERIFTQYCNHTFGVKDIERLMKLVKYIDSKGAFFVLSYADAENFKDKFREWSVLEVSVQRNIAGFSKYRRRSKELLITNIK